jgi:CrcB protein
VSAAEWIGVALLGGFGALARLLLDGALSRRIAAPWPLGTFVINVVGAFILGLLTGLGVAPHVSVLAGTAAIGSFTTFSTWMLETERIREDGAFAAAAANVLFSLLTGLGAAALGRTIGMGL